MRHRRLSIEIVILLILVIGIGLVWQPNFIRAQIAHYYYQRAATALLALDNQATTDYLVQAIKWDPELSSAQYSNFQKQRSEFLADPEHKKKYFNLNE